jgi:hypothetical protein
MKEAELNINKIMASPVFLYGCEKIEHCAELKTKKK